MKAEIVFGWLILPMLTGCAIAQQPATMPASGPAGEQKLTPQASVDQVLDALDARGKALNDFTANVSLAENDAATGVGFTRNGQVWLQRLADGKDRLRVVFDTKTTATKTIPEKIKYLLADGWLTDRDYGKKLQVRRQVLKPGEKVDLLKLGEGPFPLPLGQDKADVHRLFEVTKIDAGKDDPPNSVHLQLKPKAGTQFESKFDSLDFWVDTATNMPVRSQTLDRNQTTVRTSDLSEIKVNTNLGDKDFALDPVSDKEWELREKPFEE